MSINYYQKAIARKIGNTFKLATEEGYEPVEFAHTWLCSDVATRIFEENPIDLAQWAPYQLDSLLIELGEQGRQLTKTDKHFPEEMYWIGYVLTYWGFRDKLSGKELNQCDIVWMINQYDILHTTSVEYAIDAIKEQMNFEKTDEPEKES